MAAPRNDPPAPDRSAPPGADPAPGHNPGYAEDHPRDREDAQMTENGKRPNPDAGGADRDVNNDADPASSD